jgi:ABC-type transport system involved in cytochrome c biogenesis ATPase subunit
MKLEIDHRVKEPCTYRAERVKSLFNCEDGHQFRAAFDLPIEGRPWQIGLIVGPSGSGKTSLGRMLGTVYAPTWPARAPIVEAIAPAGDFDQVTAALAAVGLGSVPAWLRPHGVLSNGERFRADLARLVCERPEGITVLDEFTSVVDRQIARVGAAAFGKAWRRGPGQVVALSCHYDVAEWLQPDWMLDTATGKFSGDCLWRRPEIPVQIRHVPGSVWPHFEPHHYLKLPPMVAARHYVGFVGDEPVAHIAVSPKFESGRFVRACRLVIMPEWQGIGLGLRFLEAVCRSQLKGKNPWGRQCFTLFHTSHPGLVAALRKRAGWLHVSSSLFGDDKNRAAASLARSRARSGRHESIGSGFGGHLRAVNGFKFIGP